MPKTRFRPPVSIEHRIDKLIPHTGLCGWNPPKTPFLRAWIGVFKPNGRNISCYKNYCIDFNQILHPIGAQQIQDGRWPPFWQKPVKLPYHCNRLTDFDEIWHNDAHWPLTADRPLKFWISENSRWRQPPCWKSQKSRYIHNGLTDLYEIWYADAKCAS